MLVAAVTVTKQTNLCVVRVIFIRRPSSLKSGLLLARTKLIVTGASETTSNQLPPPAAPLCLQGSSSSANTAIVPIGSAIPCASRRCPPDQASRRAQTRLRRQLPCHRSNYRCSVQVGHQRAAGRGRPCGPREGRGDDRRRRAR